MIDLNYHIIYYINWYTIIDRLIQSVFQTIRFKSGENKNKFETFILNFRVWWSAYNKYDYYHRIGDVELVMDGNKQKLLIILCFDF